MNIQNTAQQELFRQLSTAGISSEQTPRFNNYQIDELGLFINSLEKSYDDFESELGENIMGRSGGLGLFLTDSLQTITKIGVRIRQYQQEKILQIMELNPVLYKRNRLHEMNQFLNCQLDIIEKTIKLIEEKLDLVMNSGVFIPETSTLEERLSPVLKNKIRSNLSKVELTYLLWWLVEAEVIHVGENLQDFIRFVENNFQYYDKEKKGYHELKKVNTVKSKFTSKTSRVETDKIRERLMKMLEETSMPPQKSILKKQTYNYE